jgi:hypothetical protein
MVAKAYDETDLNTLDTGVHNTGGVDDVGTQRSFRERDGKVKKF